MVINAGWTQALENMGNWYNGKIKFPTLGKHVILKNDEIRELNKNITLFSNVETFKFHPDVAAGGLILCVLKAPYFEMIICKKKKNLKSGCRSN